MAGSGRPREWVVGSRLGSGEQFSARSECGGGAVLAVGDGNPVPGFRATRNRANAAVIRVHQGQEPPGCDSKTP